MATPIEPPSYHEIDDTAVQDVTQNPRQEQDHKNAEETIVDLPTTRLRVRTFPRWVELEDRKSPAGALTGPKFDLLTPSGNAPELLPISPSNWAPELVVDSSLEKTAEEKILLTTPETMARKRKDSHMSDKVVVVIADDKMLSPEEEEGNDERMSTSSQDGNGPNAKHRSKRWYAQRKARYFLLAAAILILALVGVAIWLGVRKPSSAGMQDESKTPAPVAAGMAALEWTEPESGVNHRRVYSHSQRDSTIMEYSWDSTRPEWTPSVVANADVRVLNSTSLAAAAGWPHANYTYTLVSVVLNQ
jgi:hypothetical protein